jgi:hypothetical protein
MGRVSFLPAAQPAPLAVNPTPDFQVAKNSQTCDIQGDQPLGRHSSVVEQLIRNQQVLGSSPSAGSS